MFHLTFLSLFTPLNTNVICQANRQSTLATEEKEGRRCLTRSRSHSVTLNRKWDSQLCSCMMWWGSLLSSLRPGPENCHPGHKKCRAEVWRPGPRAGVMTEGPSQPGTARPGRDVNDQIMSTAFTGRRREGDNFRLLNLGVAQGTQASQFSITNPPSNLPQHHGMEAHKYTRAIYNSWSHRILFIQLRSRCLCCSLITKSSVVSEGGGGGSGLWWLLSLAAVIW